MLLIGCSSLSPISQPTITYQHPVVTNSTTSTTQTYRVKLPSANDIILINSISDPAPSPNQKPPLKQDSLDQQPLIRNIKEIAFVNEDNLEILFSPRTGTVINHISRGEKVLIFEEVSGWVNISAEKDRPFWVDKSKLCHIKNCWKSINHSKPSTTKTYKFIDNKNRYVYQSTISKKLSHSGYKNIDGNYIPSPRYADSRPSGATAKCRDGTWSFSQNSRGTCSRHGGVAKWQ